MKAREPAERHFCPLFQREISWGGAGGCYEVQEVREDNMDAELLPEPFDLNKAEDVYKRQVGQCVNALTM